MTKNLITINKFITQSLGEWKSIRSSHSLAFQEIENTTSKILINKLDIRDKKANQLLTQFNSGFEESFFAISISRLLINGLAIDVPKKYSPS